MITTMPRTHTFVSEPEVDGGFRVLNPRVLTLDGRSSLLHVDRSALRELDLHIGEGVKVANGRGVEVGGLVLGPSLNWNSAEIVITGFLPIQSEYRFGPDFRPSEIDIAVFKEVAAGVKGTVIGYFRSQIRNDATMRAEDARLLAEIFPALDCCFISIHAGKNTVSTAGLYRVRPGAEPELLDLFALKEQGYGPPNNEPISEIAVPLIGGQFLTAEDSQPALPRRISNANLTTFTHTGVTGWIEKRNLRRTLWISLALAAALLTSAAAFTLGRSASTPSRSAAAPKTEASSYKDSKIGLNMAERGPQVEIRWNSASPALATAVRGKLIITDRPARSIDLESSQVRSGLYLYKPSSRSLTVLLMINQKDGSFAGETTTFTAKHIALEQPPTVGGLSQSREAVQSAREEVAGSNRTAKWEQPAKPPNSLTQTSASQAKAAVVAHSITPEARVVGQAPIAVLALQNSPAAKMARLPTIPQPPPSILTATAASGLPVNLAPQLVPVPPAPALPVVSAPLVSSQRVSPAYPTRLLAPRLVHQAVPAVPLGVATRIRAEVRLDVSVSVDADGKATGAHIVSSEGAAAGLLAIEVLKAAQLSRFLPAQQDGKTVAGTVVLTFRFAPSRS